MKDLASKVCLSCGCCKTIDQYHKNKSSKGGYNSKCRQCRAAVRLSRFKRDEVFRQKEHARKKEMRLRAAQTPEALESKRKKEEEKARKLEAKQAAIIARAERKAKVLSRHNRLQQSKHHWARKMVQAAVKGGYLHKPNHCEDCGRILKPYQIHGHHNDYNKPLDVRWVCQLCHTRIHANEDILPEWSEFINSKATNKRGLHSPAPPLPPF